MLIKFVLAASFIILAIAYVLFYIYLAPISNFIVIGLDGFRGINLLGSPKSILNILILGGVLNLINLLLALVLAKRDQFLAHLLPFISLLISILILIGVGVIVAVN